MVFAFGQITVLELANSRRAVKSRKPEDGETELPAKSSVVSIDILYNSVVVPQRSVRLLLG